MRRQIRRLIPPLALGVVALLVGTSVPALGDPTVPPTPPEQGVSARFPGTPKWFVELTSEPTTTGGNRSTIQRQQRDVRETIRRASPGAAIGRTYQSLFNGFSVEADAAEISRIEDLAGIKAIYPVFPVSVPETRQATRPSAVPPLEVTGASIAQGTLGLSGRGVRVGIIDTGIDLDHPDLGGDGTPGGTAFPSARVAYGYDFVGDAYGVGSDGPVPDPRPDDCQGHGTHVAGIVGANGQVTGVAPEATLGAYRVFGCDGGTETDVILAAMERAQADGMDVVNLSLGASFEAWAEYPTAQAADRLALSGVVVVAAVGNDGEYLGQSLGAPATGHDVIAVAAFESETTPIPAGFSSWGLAADLTLKPDLGAPGVGIWSTMPLEKSSRHGGMSGTSMASPHVAGAVALLLEAHPGLTPAEALARLQNTARAADRKPTAQQGAGLIRVDRAATTAALVTPSKISAGESADGPRTTTLTISNPYTTAVTWTPTHQPVDTSRPAPGGGLTQNTLTLGAEQARVTFSRASVTVPPGRTAELTVTIDAPAAAVNGTVYGGFVVLTPDVGEPRRVPFAGMAGDYGSVELLPSMNKGLTTLANASCSASWGPICFDENPAWSAADQGAGFGPSRLPSVALHLAYPARSLQFAVFRADSKGLPVASSREGLLRWDRMGRSPGVLLLTWDGLQQTASGLKPAPDGGYVLGLAVEAPDGDGRVQQWYSRAFSYGQVASSPTPTPTTSPTPTLSPTPTRTATATPSPTKPPAKQFQRTAPYTLAGTHSYNGRQWFTQCEPYSATERCRTDIWATVVVIEDGQFVRRNGWAFNNLTYLPLMTRSAWGANPLAHHDWDGFTSGGRQWRTECDTAQTGRGACRSYTLTTVYSATPSASGGYRFGQANAWVFNNIVMFS